MWAIGETRAGQERRVRRDIRKLGFVPYLPEYRNLQRHRSLLLPRYIFIQRPKREPNDNWKNLFRVRGMMKIFTLSLDRPALIDDKFVDNLKALENENGVIVFGRSDKQRFEVGQCVRVVRGIFVGMLASYVGPDGDDYDLASLTILGKQVSATFSVGELEALIG